MRRVSYALTLAAMLVGSAAFAQDENKDDKKEPEKKPATKAEPKPTMVTVAQFEGKVIKVELEKKIVGIEQTGAVFDGRNFQPRSKTQDWNVADDFQVFWMHPPVELDDKGKPKKPKEVKKPVKGPGGISGYPTEPETLRRDQQVRVVLQKKKETRTAGKKDTDENKPVVTAVYILFEPKK
jgi:hypothetical protein